MKINLTKHIWEGWTVGDFINELSWQIEMIMNGNTTQKTFTNKKELVEWCASNQTYYKKKIADVNNYFANKYCLK